MRAKAAIALTLFAAGCGGEEESSVPQQPRLPEAEEVPQQKETDLEKAAAAADCTLRSERQDSRDHVQVRVPYSSNPPVGGAHFQMPAEDAAYPQPPPREAVVHSMEHGRVIVWFANSVSAKQVGQLRGLYEEDPRQTLLVPDAAKMPFAVAATAWNRDPEPNGTGQLLGCRQLNEKTFDALRAFRDRHRGKGPEPIP